MKASKNNKIESVTVKNAVEKLHIWLNAKWLLKLAEEAETESVKLSSQKYQIRKEKAATQVKKNKS